MNKRIGELLVERQLVQAEDIDKALKIQESVGGRLGSILTRIGATSEDAVLSALSDQLGWPVLGDGLALPDDLSMYNFLRQSKIQFDWFLDQSVIIWPIETGQLGCLARDPLNTNIRETLRYFYPDEAVSYFLSRGHHLDLLLDFISRERAVEALFDGDGDIKALKELAEEAPVVELVSNVIAQAVEADASDIHFEPADDFFHIRFRVDGVLYHRLTQPKERFAAIASRIKLISGIDISERRLPQDGRLTLRVSGREMDIRVSTVPEVEGESIVLRLLPKEREDLSLAHLGLEQDHQVVLEGWSRESGGVVLVTGPTGSGKSTTLHAMLESANDGERKVISVEDPVEIHMPGMTQIQTHAEIGYTFARALRAILRQDPDVIMIGEIRDLETAEIAIQSALSGHLVLSTIHTNDAVSAFTRLVDMGVEPFLVASPIKGVMAQRLVRKVCEQCAESYCPPASIVDEVSPILNAVSESSKANGQAQWKRAKGCPSCHDTGYRGRLGIYEVIPLDQSLRTLIANNETALTIGTRVREQGWRSLREDGLIKAHNGVTTVEEVLRVVGHQS